MAQLDPAAAKEVLGTLLAHNPDQFLVVAATDPFRDAAVAILSSAVSAPEPAVTIATYNSDLAQPLSNRDANAAGRIAANAYRSRYGHDPEQIREIVPNGHRATVAAYRGSDVKFVVHAVDTIAGRTLR